MCGRYVTPQEAEIERYWSAKPRKPGESFKQRFNAAPTLMLPIIRGPDRQVDLLRWGLIPSWAKDPSIGARMNNARAETVAEKPSFRTAFKRRRCIIPMLGFYEWKATPAGKIPHYISPKHAEQFAVAGVWEHWEGGGAGPIESFAVITTVPNELMAYIHDRMPVILSPDDIDPWLEPDNQDNQGLQELLQPYPADQMQEWAVSTLVNSARHESPELIAPFDD